MEFRRAIGKSVSFTSSEASSSSSGTFQTEPYRNYILQDPSIKLEIPGFNVIANYEKIIGQNEVHTINEEDEESSLTMKQPNLFLCGKNLFINGTHCL